MKYYFNSLHNINLLVGGLQLAIVGGLQLAKNSF